MNVRITSKGQVTIPADIRERAGLLPHTEVEFDFDGKTVRLRRAAKRRKPTRGEEIVNRIRGKATVKMSTDEIMKLMRG